MVFTRCGGQHRQGDLAATPDLGQAAVPCGGREALPGEDTLDLQTLGPRLFSGKGDLSIWRFFFHENAAFFSSFGLSESHQSDINCMSSRKEKENPIKA